jgi:hypothetical protein
VDDNELGIEGASKIGYAINGQQTLEMFSCRDSGKDTFALPRS